MTASFVRFLDFFRVEDPTDFEDDDVTDTTFTPVETFVPDEYSLIDTSDMMHTCVGPQNGRRHLILMRNKAIAFHHEHFLKTQQ